MTDPNCKECNGDGFIVYGGVRHSYFGDDNDDGTEVESCPVCNNCEYDEDEAYEQWIDSHLEGDIEE